ncbi:MAG: transcriptional repressor [Actinobacteria bacterium]|nr:transcriptional repressor [Actinomycetota bacterium]
MVITAFRAAGCRITPQRRAIVKEAMTQTGHINPADLAGRVVKNLPGVHAATVYHTGSSMS